MIRLKSILAAAFLATVGLLAPASAAPQPVARPAPAAIEAHPALWKVADKDTTIFLFGTVHILPKGVVWFQGPVEYAFNHSDQLVTELPDVSPVQVIQGMVKYGVLPKGQSLRDKLSPAQRGRYEAVLAGLGEKPDKFDRNKPWVPATLIPLLTVQKAGYDSSFGAEAVLDARAKQRAIPRLGLESVDFQFGLMAAQSEADQIKFLDIVLNGVSELEPTISEMVKYWSAGDAVRLAATLNADEEDPVFAEAMLFGRNRTWAQWVKNRMAQPGTVFIAVGAGHLGGARSLTDLLAKDGYRLERVQ